MVEVKEIVKNYGNKNVVDHLSFTVEKGQIIGLLGPNGAGKSTTMNIITGYIAPTSGSVSVNGYDMAERPEKAKCCIGYLPEIPPLYLDMKVKEYLNFAADLKRIKKSERKVQLKQVTELAMITDVAERLIKNLSKGYKQRVGLAGALIGSPEILILDEPTVGLDPVQIIEIRDLIRKLSKNHMIILSSHILSEISAVCDKVLILNKGKLVASDTPENLINHINHSTGIELEVKGEKERIEQILSIIEEIENVDFSKNSANDIVSFTVYSKEEKELREAIFYAFADAKCPIYKMQKSSMSLEEAFLEITKDSPIDQVKIEEEEVEC